MDKVRKPSNSGCYTPSSEPYRTYPVIWLEACMETHKKKIPAWIGGVLARIRTQYLLNTNLGFTCTSTWSLKLKVEAE
jgi:hypothetical protein